MVVLFNLLNDNIFSKFDISSEHLFILELLNSSSNELENYLNSIKNSGLLLQNLVRRGFINEEYELTPKGAEVINNLNLVINTLKETDEIPIDNFDDFFHDFWELYPHKVPNGYGGVRILRSKDVDSLNGKKVKKDLFKLLKKGEEKGNILLGLKNQISISGDCRYFQNIETWVNQRTYEKYLDIENTTEERYSKG